MLPIEGNPALVVVPPPPDRAVDDQLAGSPAPPAPGPQAAHDAGHGAVRLEPRQVTRVLALAVVVLTLLHLAGAYLRYGLGYDYAKGAVPMFDFNMEANAPTWFSSALLLLAAVAAAAVALQARRLRGYWLAMAGVLVFLSFDESVQLHELITVALRSALAVGPGFSGTVVVIVGLLPVLLGAALFYRFMRAIPRPTAAGLLAAGAVYLTGAVGIDTIAAAVAFAGDHAALDVALNTLEELFEMVGVILLIHALLAHLLRRDVARPAAA